MLESGSGADTAVYANKSGRAARVTRRCMVGVADVVQGARERKFGGRKAPRTMNDEERERRAVGKLNTARVQRAGAQCCAKSGSGGWGFERSKGATGNQGWKIKLIALTTHVHHCLDC